jgi:hypothetical protein
MPFSLKSITPPALIIEKYTCSNPFFRQQKLLCQKKKKNTYHSKSIFLRVLEQGGAINGIQAFPEIPN